MTNLRQLDVAVLGGGFGGTLTAMLLDRIGLKPIVLDAGRHPRFAIGESSTPIGNLVLSGLARRYQLTWLAPFSKYGTWKEAHPQVVCGPKRGFSYFTQPVGQPFAQHPDHSSELLVAASHNLKHADTHWLRADFDHFLAEKTVDEGIEYVDQVDVGIEQNANGWRLDCVRGNHSFGVEAKFLIDATGSAATVPKALGIPIDRQAFRTNSRSIFGHFLGVLPWADVLAGDGASCEDYPFPCDHAALHHLLPDGWMWQLRFDNGVTSAGFVLQGDAREAWNDEWGARTWRQLVDRHPSVTRQFRHATLAPSCSRLRTTGRLQRRATKLAGPTWALLPHSCGFVDPLHSTGIAHTLTGIERLVAIMQDNWELSSLANALQRYEKTVYEELDMVDRLVAAAYDSLSDFRLFTSTSMLYFAAATTYEHRRVGGDLAAGSAFLCADDSKLRQLVTRAGQWLNVAREASSDEAVERYLDQVAEGVEPFNVAGLCNPECHNMYRYTAAPVDDP